MWWIPWNLSLEKCIQPPNLHMISGFNPKLKPPSSKILSSPEKSVLTPCQIGLVSPFHILLQYHVHVSHYNYLVSSPLYSTSLRVVTILLIFLSLAPSTAHRSYYQKIEVECSWRTKHLSLWTIYPLSKHLWRACCVPGVVLGAEDTKINKTNVILILTEITV